MSSPSAVHRTYSFGEFTLDLDRGALLRAGADIKLRPKSFEMLSYLLERQGVLVSKDELLGAIWGPTVVTEDAITHCVTEIRRALDDQSQNMLRTIPRRGYIFDCPVALSEEPSRSGLASGWPRWGLAAALVLVLGLASTWWGLGDRAVNVSVTTTPHSIAVLPFVNLSDSTDDEYFSDGLTETLLHALAQLPDLKVSARTSAFYFKGRNMDVREIADTLGVKNVLEGSVQRDGDRIRIVVQLVEADTGFHLWSNTYRREMTSIFDVQDDIANRVAQAMQITLIDDIDGGQIESVSTSNVAAFLSYLKGLQHLNVGGNNNYLFAEISFKEALGLDSDFFEARLWLAYTFYVQNANGLIGFSKRNEHMRPLLAKVLENQPDNGMALALATLFPPGKTVAEREKDLAGLIAVVERTPNVPYLYRRIASILRGLYREEEALQWLDRGLEIDPLSTILHSARARLLMRAGDINAADQTYARAIELHPDASFGYGGAARVAWTRKHYIDWFVLRRKAIERDPLDHEIPVQMANHLYEMGLMDEGDKYFQLAVSLGPDKAVVRASELYRLVLDMDDSQALALSRSLLSDNIATRNSSFWYALTTYMSVMAEMNNIDAALSYLEELLPGILSPEFEPRTGKERDLQYFAALALARSRSQEDARKMLDTIVARWDESFPTWRRHHTMVASILMARGETERAIELALADIESEADPGRRYFEYYAPPAAQIDYYYAPIAQQPPVAKLIKELEAKKRKAGEELWEYIVENELQL